MVSVGTDHHPFDRLISWVDAWLADQGGNVDAIFQHGSSRPSSIGKSALILPHDELLNLFRESTVVVTQVGPGTILDANSVGRKPIVVARNPRLGEHVDGHQIAFGKLMHDRGAAFMVDSEESLRAAIERALDDPQWSRMPQRPSPAPRTAEVLADVVANAVARPAGFFSWSRFVQMFRRPAAGSRGLVRASEEHGRIEPSPVRDEK